MKGIEILTKEPILELSKTLSIICMILFAVFIISLICLMYPDSAGGLILNILPPSLLHT